MLANTHMEKTQYHLYFTYMETEAWKRHMAYPQSLTDKWFYHNWNLKSLTKKSREED